MKIKEILFTSDAGTILPELQWHEEIRITTTAATFSRNGKTQDSRVNSGTWVIPMDEVSGRRLFETLQAVDCSKIKRIEALDAPEGAGTRSYTLNYANGKTCSLYFDAGTTYEHGEMITDPLNEFIGNLNFPAEAKRQY